jgi:hypothetical protein
LWITLWITRREGSGEKWEGLLQLRRSPRA